ncbi:NAD(P)H-binding protein [Litoribacter ruber]|uniref:NAD(P)H-binding protein n=1 Tax=Litoribacter ruber TaxID=702568 RepID=UPI001BD93FB0|nr:NAD(P)H-binding protein [Litoribacter ruber]MBT0810824.1 NAD(P)H-binding protein [Litoribacter ruber]
MDKILLAGASGTLGLEILKILTQNGHLVRALIHDDENIEQVRRLTEDIVIQDVQKPIHELGVFENVNILLSSIGKSVSIFRSTEGTYDSIDFHGNKNLFEQASQAGVKRGIFVSIMGASEENSLELAQVHYKAEKALAENFKNHTIIRPAGFFGGLNDLIKLGKHGMIPVIGDGSPKTNSIYQGDLAQLIYDNLNAGPEIMEIGGPLIHTRLEMAEMIQRKTGGEILKVPNTAVKGSILPLSVLKPDLFHNMDYFRFVCSKDMIGEKHGKMTFEEYLDQLDLNQI